MVIEFGLYASVVPKSKRTPTMMIVLLSILIGWLYTKVALCPLRIKFIMVHFFNIFLLTQKEKVLLLLATVHYFSLSINYKTDSKAERMMSHFRLYRCLSSCEDVGV